MRTVAALRNDDPESIRIEAGARCLASGCRQASLETLVPLSLDALARVEQATRLTALADGVRQAAGDPSLVGDPDADLHEPAGRP